ncbi:Cation transport protein [Synechococcus sp. PCC 7335]|uniref:TrkH family potassium uptake protein n=1 Tax=Synechococcus sp. (strain ATCC 29403 / PCC 7335) TaxID=91464 RepID=UPI00017EB47D|nr:potassium transporter TrkG [Synechococcus sp. PCC 7335]EDX85563.1 Cation transport protein [Synechococcus sp. PCC 7335]
MKIYLTAISRDVSRFLLIPIGMLLLSLPICLIAREWFAVLPFLASLLITSLLALLLHSLGKKPASVPTKQTLISVALSWGLIAVIGGLPIWFTAIAMGDLASPTVGYFTNFINALFEGFSGLTSTGLTMVLRESELPACLQWWRSLMEWVGGLGLIVFAIALLEPLQDQYSLYQAETRDAQMRLTMTRTVRRICVIYALYTIASIVLFRVTGMNWWPALNHAMTAISTGGFSVTDNSMAVYGTFTKMAIVLVMVVGAIAFNQHDQFLEGQLLTFWRDRQHRLMWLLLIVGSVIVAAEQYSTSAQFAWVDSIFQWTSALTTCGFSTQSIQFMSSTNKLLLSLAMVIGGAAGSTAGGVKLSRTLALGEGVSWHFRKLSLSAHQVYIRQINRKALLPDQASRQVEEAAVLLVLWLVCLLGCVLVLVRLVPNEYTLSDVIFESASALGAAGLSSGISGPSLHWLGKCALMLMMWMGRLEIIPVVILLTAPFSYVLGAIDRR